MRSAAKRQAPAKGPISEAIAASAEGLTATGLRPKTREMDLDTIATLLSQPAWDKIGFHLRLAFAILNSEAVKGVDIGQTVAGLLDDDSEPPFEDTLVKMSQARIAIVEIAAMMKVSLRKQWTAVDAYLVSKGLPATQADDEICDDDELLALRPAFEAGRAQMTDATNAVAIAERRYKAESPRRKAAYKSQCDAIDADKHVVDRVAALRARTKEGIRFKQEVRAYWDDCESRDLDASILADLLAYVEASP